MDPADSVPGSAKVNRFDAWQRRLLDLSLRNSMLNVPLKTRQIELLMPDVGSFEDQLAAGKLFLLEALPDGAAPRGRASGAEPAMTVEPCVMPPLPHAGGEDMPGRENPDPTPESAAQELSRKLAEHAFRRRSLLCVYQGRAPVERRIQQLYREAKRNLEELGCNTLFVAVGLLRWQREDDPDRRFLAPLLMIPVEMTRRGSDYSLKAADGETRFNLTLLELLKQEFHLPLPELETALPMDDAGVDVPRVFDIVRQAVADRDGWRVEERCTLGTFSFAKFLMWRDMMERRDALVNNALVSHIANRTRGAFPEQYAFPGIHELECDLPARDLCAPLSADATQLSAVVAAARGKNFVLVGPPGTGKSQTIANMIAQCCAEGKSVLFVAEKAAALNVVYKRLCRIGLGDFCLELHSNKADRARTLRQFAAVRDLVEHFRESDWFEATERLERERAILDSIPRSLHAEQPEGVSLFRYLVVSQAARHLPAPLPGKSSEPSADGVSGAAGGVADTRAFHLGLRPEAEMLAAQFRVLGGAAGGALDYVHMPATAARVEHEAFAAALAELQAAQDAVLQSAARLAASVNLILPEDFSYDLVESLSDLAAFAGKRRAAEGIPYGELAALVAEYRAAQLRLSVPYPAGAELEASLEQWRRQCWETQMSWFLPRWLGMRKMRRLMALLSGQPPESIHILQDLDALIAMGKVRRAFDDLTPGLAATPHVTTTLRQDADRWRSAWQKALETGKLTALPSTLAEQQACVREILEKRHLWRDWGLWCESAAEARARGYGELVSWLEQGACQPEELASCAAATYAQRRAESIVAEDPALARFSTVVHEQHLASFCAADDEVLRLAGPYVRHLLFLRAQGIRDAACQPELNLLQRELGKTRGHLSLRRLISSLPRTLTLLKPCVLMSPLSAAQYLDANREPFDVVIFDEASQIPVWDAIGVISRGKSAVIVGDPRQMPPTSFFSKQEYDSQDPDETEQDLESILDECLACGVPSLNLRWHFRSRSESLIAFSNRHYYGGSLITFPNPSTADSALQLHRVQGVYDRGTTRTNPAEARALVDHVVSTLTSPGFEYTEMSSIGIVTFNAQQQELIEDLLDEARAADPSLEAFFDETVAEAVFVKNLENVQGDERGVIYFSTTFGPDKTGAVSLNFGPLNLKGGERRLNVAITRARASLHVFSSLTPDMIDLDRTSARGVADLRAFLEWAAQSSSCDPCREDALRSAAEMQRRALPADAAGTGNSGLAESVAEALTQRGWICRCHVGISEPRIDVAVVDPRHPESYVAAIEIDSKPQEQTARDRDKLRDAVLEGLGWEVIHLWALDWWRDPERETQRLLSALDALAERGSKPPVSYPSLLQAVPQGKEPPVREGEDTVPDAAMPELPEYEAFAGGVLQPLELDAASLAELMLSAVGVEGPVALPRLAAAMCSRATPALVRRVGLRVATLGYRLVLRGSLVLEDERTAGAPVPVYRLPSQPACRLRRRGPRDWAEIPPSELRAAAELARVHGRFFAGSDDHLRATACLFGKVRMSSSVRESLRQAICLPPAAVQDDDRALGDDADGLVLFQDIGYKKVSGHRLQKFQDIGNTFG